MIHSIYLGDVLVLPLLPVLQNFVHSYAKSVNGEIFNNIMDLILSRENILLAYRNIKANTGSNMAGTDKLAIKDIGRLPPEEVVEFVRSLLMANTATVQ